jgi:CRP/FNR family transcriptional regulator
MPVNAPRHSLEALCKFESDAECLLRTSIRILTLAPGTLIFQPGQACERYIHLCEGRVRVYLAGPEGNSVMLYRIKPGEACVLTNAALLAEENYVAFAVAETQVTVQVLGSEAARALLARSAAFQSRFFGDQGRKSCNCWTLGRTTFERVNVRLKHVLHAVKDADSVVSMTHHELALEVGPAREVISRDLKCLERFRFLKLSRGKIHILGTHCTTDAAGEIPNRRWNARSTEDYRSSVQHFSAPGASVAPGGRGSSRISKNSS